MKRLVVALMGVVLGLALSMSPAEAAKRLGSGQSSGAQRDGVTQRQAVPPQGAAAAPGAQQPKSGMSRWLGPLAGLAAGLGLAYLLGDQLGSMVMGLLMIAALVIGAVFVMRMLSRNRQQPAMQGAGATPGGATQSQYSGLGGMQQPGQGGAAGYAPAAAAPAALAAAVPPGFNVAQFVDQAKRVFVDLQGANDRGDLEALREMSSDEMFETFRKDIAARNGAPQKVEVVWLQADLLEVVNEGGFQWASVRYSGSLRDAPGATPEEFTEVWNLQKPADGSGGWVLAGIQQVS